MSLVLGTSTRILTRGADGDANVPNHNTLMQRTREIVTMKEQSPERESKEIEETATNPIKKC